MKNVERTSAETKIRDFFDKIGSLIKDMEDANVNEVFIESDNVKAVEERGTRLKPSHARRYVVLRSSIVQRYKHRMRRG